MDGASSHSGKISQEVNYTKQKRGYWIITGHPSHLKRLLMRLIRMTELYLEIKIRSSNNLEDHTWYHQVQNMV